MISDKMKEVVIDTMFEVAQAETMEDEKKSEVVGLLLMKEGVFEEFIGRILAA